jgi:hypothetical protein
METNDSYCGGGANAKVVNACRSEQRARPTLQCSRDTTLPHCEADVRLAEVRERRPL